MAIAPSIYHVRYSDWTSGVPHEIVIQPNQVNNSTTLTLPGSGKLDYGQFMDQNILVMTEHFANDIAPVNPIKGQLWYHTTQKKLRLYDLSSDPTTNNWSSIQQTRYGTTHPYYVDGLVGGAGYVDGTYSAVPLTGGAGTGALATIVVLGGAVVRVTVTTPGTGYVNGNVLSASNTNLGGSGAGFAVTVTNFIGELFYNTSSNYFQYWDSNSWETFLTSTVGNATYVLKAGDTMTGNLNMGGANKVTGLASPTAASDATNKSYVDAADALKVAKAGDTMTGFLTLSGLPTSNLHAATKSYVDNNDALKVAKAGDTMTGNLTISKSSPFLLLNSTNDGLGRGFKTTTNGVERWAVGDNGVEGGGNTGSNFVISRRNDGGSFVDTPLSITRSSGTVNIGTTNTSTPLIVTGSLMLLNSVPLNTSAVMQLRGPAAQERYFSITTNTTMRWAFGSDATNEVGGNTGSHFFLNRYTDGGVGSRVVTVYRNTGDLDVYGDISFAGGTKFIHNVTDPVANQDAATKKYVDDAVATASGSVLKAQNGYEIRPNGMIDQWGLAPEAEAPGVYNVTFPIPFPTACVYINVQLEYKSFGGHSSQVYSIEVFNRSTTGFSFITIEDDGVPQNDQALWTAKGY